VCADLKEVKKRRWKWIGHVLRMQPSEDPIKALKWLPFGRRKVGRFAQHGAERLSRKGVKNWGGRVGKRLVKLRPTGLKSR